MKAYEGYVVTHQTVPKRRSMRCSVLAVSLLAALPCAAQSLRVDYDVGASVLYSDNINLSEDAPDSDVILSPELNFDATKAGSDIQLRARGKLQYLEYRDNTYPDEARGEFAGQFNWNLLPDRLSFVAEDYLGRQPIDLLSGYTPTNQQQINVFTAGPTLFARFGDATRGQLDLRYTNTYAEETRQFNGNRYNAALRLFRELSPLQSLSANVEATDVKFDTAGLNADYTRYDGYVGYRRESANLDLDLAVGYTRLEGGQTTGPGRASSPLARGQADWKVGPRSTFGVDVSYQFADATTDLIAQGDRLDQPVIEDLGTSTTLVSPQLYRQRRYEFNYRFEGPRLSFAVRPFVERLDYRDALQVDWEASGAYLDAEFRIAPRQTLSLSAVGERRKFVDASRRDDDTAVRLQFANRFTRHVWGTLALQRRERASSAPGQDYVENIASVGLIWRR